MISWMRQKIGRLFERRSRVTGGHPSDPGLAEIFGGGTANSGTRVDETTAMNVTAVYACVRVLAEGLAMMPWGMYELLPGGGKTPAPQHRLNQVLSRLPNPEMTAYTFIETLMGHLAIRGNALAYIHRDGGGRPLELWPIRPDRVIPMRVNGRLLYSVFFPPANSSGWGAWLDAWPWWETHTPITLPAESVLHVKSLSAEGILGLSPISMIREAVGLALATEEYGARNFSNNVRPGGVLEHPGRLSDDAAKKLKASIEKVHMGLASSHKLMLLEEGMSWKAVSFSPEDAQYLATRVFQLEEIARAFLVPLHRLGHLKNASYASIEQTGIDFATYTMTPWAVRFEQEAYRQLFLPSDRGRFVAEFDMSILLRADIKSRYTAHQLARNSGFKSVNEIRRDEGLPPIGARGDIYLQPVNMVPAGEVLLPRPGAELEPDKSAADGGETVANDEEADPADAKSAPAPAGDDNEAPKPSEE